MNADTLQVAMGTWAAKDLPARLDVRQTAKLLGFAEHDIQILTATKKLTPLGDPTPNAPKWFAAVEILQLMADVGWLNKATKEVSKYWRCKRERRGNPSSILESVRRPTTETATHGNSHSATGVVNASESASNLAGRPQIAVCGAARTDRADMPPAHQFSGDN
jgi:hypothetical protein